MVRVKPRQALHAHLKADPGVKAAVGTRVYQRRVPQGATKPLILIYPPVTDVPTRDLDGVAYRRAHLQVTAFADTQPDAETAADAVVDAVEGFAGQMAGALHVILATAEAEEQVDQEGVDEIRHHVDVVIKYKR